MGGLNFKSDTVKRALYTSTPHTLNPQPPTLNLEPSTLNPPSSTTNPNPQSIMQELEGKEWSAKFLGDYYNAQAVLAGSVTSEP